MSRLCGARVYPKSKRREHGTKRFILQTAISISGSIEIVFGRLVASIKCWSDLQLLSAGIGTGVIFEFIKSILKSLVILCIVVVLSSAIYSRIAPSFALNRIFIPANENGTVKQNNQSDFKAFLN